MSFVNSLKRVATRLGTQVGRDLTRGARQKRGQRTRAGLRFRREAQSSVHRQTPELPGPRERAIEYDIERYGLPDFDYRPERNGAPDPGEVVWTWVPFDENDGRGKDRPVLVLADTDEHVIFGQMTSKDNTRDAQWEAKWGRHWMDVGSGKWDRKGRPSEVRLDRLLIAHMDQIRREGSFLREDIFADVVRALKNLHG
ncbi:hypothetical protein J2S70_000204 [Trueperella bonasi]|uniref:PemK-like, MazF-like toxin of type II toxin-antitoxin system n=1 Tax=Trueperella bonasi TaxID=312286 RepID=A0ABT9NE10_9ACTO|nr:type II toxin-antitoxin system PemK/MazF family toxin [Trueperella bonasi]MDP9805622.1 hypothetical protein [Trueperella bonasi]